jgi:hypothetical protein
LFSTTIYPTGEEMRETTFEYMTDHHADFLKKFKKNQWQVFYDKNIAQDVSFKQFSYDLSNLHFVH